MQDAGEVGDVQRLQRVLHDGSDVDVVVGHDVGHVAVDKNFTRRRLGDLVGGHPAVGTTDPQMLRCLLVGEPLEELRIGPDHLLGLRKRGGEGLLGFSQAILARGSQSLLVSLWPVSDTATSLLMTRFYENWLGKGMAGPPQNVSKADALREAKDWLSKLRRKEIEAQIARLPEGARGLKLEPVSDGGLHEADDRPFAHPYYWSAFILIGDPR